MEIRWHRYRSHTCGAPGERYRPERSLVRLAVTGTASCSVLFIDLRDHYGLTQWCCRPDLPAFKVAESLRSEWVVRIDGKVRRRPDTDNLDLATGLVEPYVTEIEVLGPAAELPMPVFGEASILAISGSSTADLRRDKLQRNIKRGQIIDLIRRWRKSRSFESADPDPDGAAGACDFLVPSCLHPGKLPRSVAAGPAAVQAACWLPASTAISIAPCFRDEDARADRSPGEFYQLDVEMSLLLRMMCSAPHELADARRV